ncbi:SphA family protein [Amphritea pacifica]|uniref:Transporter n=1 Tax=Amphritea pacifica TaxID=2811233 RepID=A0ABS2W2Q4_9GAMM|nr:transporter [Amphritea pacifica]MBN0986000.1 transporter [Amphritea pacifica]
MKNSVLSGLCYSSCIAFAIASLPGHASENGAPTTPMGVFEFGTGFMPPATPSGTFATRAAYYSTDKVVDSHGDKITGQDFSLDVFSISAVYLNMTDEEILGAKYGYSAILPFLKMNADLSVSVPGVGVVFEDNADLFRQGDMQIIPLILQWNLAPNLAMNTQLQIQLPTGDYDKNRLVSPGLNHWVISPNYGVSYISDAGYEVSSSFQLDISSENPDTHYTNGVEYRHEFGVGKHTGPWTVGLGGYFYRQLTDDEGPGVIDGNKGTVTALGPALSYFSPGKPAVWLHAYKEFNAENRAEGYNLALRVAMSF